MKLAISGKGGVGKTTLAALLSRYLVAKGKDVIAVDADPDANLAAALGLADKTITPIADMKELIEERTGSKGGYGTFFKLNPDVSDLPERFSVVDGNLRLLVMGGVPAGGSGCICPESAMLRALATNLLLHRDQYVVLDMEAGIEHLGRATAKAVSAMVVVVEPGMRSIQTALVVKRLAAEIGIENVSAVVNKVRDQAVIPKIEAQLGDVPLVGVIPFSDTMAVADLESRGVFDGSPPQMDLIGGIAKRLLPDLDV
ncbi:MAG: AAA family ATPase [Phycisphaerae bacterium]|nr:AAA family ATPase [Phycisphaerae bacterium]